MTLQEEQGNQVGLIWHVYVFVLGNLFVSREGSVAACGLPVARGGHRAYISRGGIAWFRVLPARRFGVPVHIAEVL